MDNELEQRMTAVEARIAVMAEADHATDARLDGVEANLGKQTSRNRIAVQELRRVISWCLGAGALIYLWLNVGDSDRATIAKSALNQLVPVAIGIISLLLSGPDLLKRFQSTPPERGG